MYELVAVYNDIGQDKIGGPFVDHYREEVVALFTSKELADNYIKLSRLKNPIRRTFASTRVFRRNSLLRNAESAFIQPKEDPLLVIDPTL